MNEFKVGNQLTLIKIIGKDNGKNNIFYDKLDASFIQFHFCISGSITLWGSFEEGEYLINFGWCANAHVKFIEQTIKNKINFFIYFYLNL